MIIFSHGCGHFLDLTKTLQFFRYRSVPAATPTFMISPPPSKPGSRNYKLDKLRSKAIGLGKLASALKQGSAEKNTAQIGNSKTNDSVRGSDEATGCRTPVLPVKLESKATTKDNLKNPTGDKNPEIGMKQVSEQNERTRTQGNNCGVCNGSWNIYNYMLLDLLFSYGFKNAFCKFYINAASIIFYMSS